MKTSGFAEADDQLGADLLHPADLAYKHWAVSGNLLGGSNSSAPTI